LDKLGAMPWQGFGYKMPVPLTIFNFYDG
jgi:hypothetical protein